MWREVPWVKRRPSEYVREHFRFTTAPLHLPSDPAAIDELLEMMDGPGMIMYASDYPHDHGDGLRALLERLSPDQRRRAMGGTAAPSPKLTSREEQVLELAAAGLTISQIATSLHISHSTAKTHLLRVYAKLEAPNRSAAVAIALAHGMLGSTAAAA